MNSRPIRECLGQAVGFRLNGVGNGNTQPAAVVQQLPKAADVLRRRDQQDVANAGQHQHRQGIIDHRLVVDGQQLLAHRPGDRKEPRARPPGEDDPFGEKLLHDFGRLARSVSGRDPINWCDHNTAGACGAAREARRWGTVPIFAGTARAPMRSIGRRWSAKMGLSPSTLGTLL